ncbi:MAG: OsmC family protein [Solirubrobacterales bacterium]
MTATARRLGEGLTNEVDINGRHTITTDEPLSLGGADRGPAPHELLPAALASCITTTIASYAQRRDWKLDGLEVEVAYDPETSPRRFEVAVRLGDGLSPEQIERLERVSARCPVRRALEAGFSFKERLHSMPRAA